MFLPARLRRVTVRRRRIVLHTVREDYATTNWLASAARPGNAGRPVVGAGLLDHEIFQQKTVVRWRRRLFALNAKDGPTLALIVFRFRTRTSLCDAPQFGQLKSILGAPTGTGRQFSAALISLAFSDFSRRFPVRFHGSGASLFADHPLIDLRDLQNAFKHEESLSLMQGRFLGFLRYGD
jgi:hypothetical protein